MVLKVVDRGAMVETPEVDIAGADEVIAEDWYIGLRWEGLTKGGVWMLRVWVSGV